MITWIRDCLPEGSRERRTEIRHMAGKESWLTRRWNARRRLRALTQVERIDQELEENLLREAS